MIYQNEILGGLLIGVASALPMLFEGRIAGVSGYAAQSLRPNSVSGLSGFLFVFGLILGGLIWRVAGGHLPAPDSFTLHTRFWILAGVLVGFGSRLSGGCTSGHGVCGLGRASPRSLVSVIIFMFFAILTTVFMRMFL